MKNDTIKTLEKLGFTPAAINRIMKNTLENWIYSNEASEIS